MYHLATVFPKVKRLRIPVSRDRAMLLLLALNEIMLGAEIFLAHSTSGTIMPKEWIPIIFGPGAGISLLLTELLTTKKRSVGAIISSLIFLASIIVGLLGMYFHVSRAILPLAPPGERVSIPLIIWAPPILAPLTFALVGWMGLSAIWPEIPGDSGRILLPARRQLLFPFSKTNAFFIMVGLGCLATVISSVLDHARTNFENPWLWLPTSLGVFGTVVALLLGFTRIPRRSDLIIFVVAMILFVLVGLLGVALHVMRNLGLDHAIVVERFLRGAPILAPMLFSDMGALGLVILLDPKENKRGASAEIV
jgi:MFS family permease